MYPYGDDGGGGLAGWSSRVLHTNDKWPFQYLVGRGGGPTRGKSNSHESIEVLALRVERYGNDIDLNGIRATVVTCHPKLAAAYVAGRVRGEEKRMSDERKELSESPSPFVAIPQATLPMVWWPEGITNPGREKNV